jgi:CRP-like cAMP-binding protein
VTLSPTRLPKADHRTNRLLAALEPEDLTALEPDLELITLTRGDILYDTGDVIRHVYFPHTTIIALVNVLEDSTSEVAMFGREGAVGLLSALITREAFGRYVVQMSGTASRMAVQRMTEVRNARPNLRRLIMHYGEAFLIQMFQSVSCNAVHAVEARCCRWILSMHDRTDQDTLPLTHEFLAEMLGVQRSTVSTVTRALQTAGLIRQNRGGITVIDRTGLEATACECYGKIRQVYQRLLPGTYFEPTSAPVGVTRMPKHFTDRCAGPIKGLSLPLSVWNALSEEGITTIDQLRAVADDLEQIPGIGVKLARITRDELARVSSPDEGSQSQN